MGVLPGQASQSRTWGQKEEDETTLKLSVLCYVEL